MKRTTQRWWFFLAIACILSLTLGAAFFFPRAKTFADNQPLRDLAQAKGLLIGAAVNTDVLTSDSNYSNVLGREFNAVTAENSMKWDGTEPQQGTFTFTAGDSLVTFAQQHSMQVRGHTLVWNQQLPDWVRNGNFTHDQWLDILHQHIRGVVSHYKNSINIWDVVNEAVADSADKQDANGFKTDYFWYQKVGPDFLDNAFRWAHEENPNAKLYLNEYGAEETGTKADLVYNLVKGMIARGVPINGVGMQMHVGWNGYIPSIPNIQQNMQRLGDLGLEVQITELDVQLHYFSGSQDDKRQRQAQVYADMTKACLAVTACKGIITWGVDDGHSWLPSFTGNADEEGLLFDKNYQPKPAYYSVANALGATSGTPGGGSTNLALNKSVITSSVEANNDSYSASKAVDGDTGTRWSSDFRDPQWLRIDLGSTQTIKKVVLRWEAAYSSEYRIEVSDNDNNWTSIYNTSNGKGGVEELTNLNGSGRYIRIFSTKRATEWGNSLYEFEVYSSN